MATNIFCLFFLASINTLFALNFIKQTNTNDKGENPRLLYDLNSKGGQKNCLTLAATGTIGKVNMTFLFDGQGDAEAWAADMFLTVNATSIPGDNSACYQWGGYDLNVC